MEAGFIYQQPLAAMWCAAFGWVCAPGQPRGCSWDGPDSWAAPPILLLAAVVVASFDRFAATTPAWPSAAPFCLWAI